MDSADPSDKVLRLAQFREKIKSLPIEELIALAAIMKRRTDDLEEELKALAEQLIQRRTEELRQKHSR